ncbi:MAG: fumarylacetoacetate hydrolase family protein [Rhizobiaceae bacterium]
MDIDKMAAEIVAARRSGVQNKIQWPDPAPSMADARAIQSAVFEKYDSPSVGWKVGATNKPAQQAFGIDEPFYGPMPEAGVMESGADLKKTDCVMACEPEYAFKLARDFPASDGEKINVESASQAVEKVHIAIEVIGRTIGNPDFANGLGVTMDFGGNVAFVVGPEVDDWQSQDFANGVVESRIDGEVVATGNGQSAMDNPINSLVWIAQTLADQGGQLKAGEWISTGTCTAPVPIQAGTTYSAKFADFGEVRVNFT